MRGVDLASLAAEGLDDAAVGAGGAGVGERARGGARRTLPGAASARGRAGRGVGVAVGVGVDARRVGGRGVGVAVGALGAFLGLGFGGVGGGGGFGDGEGAVGPGVGALHRGLRAFGGFEFGFELLSRRHRNEGAGVIFSRAGRRDDEVARRTNVDEDVGRTRVDVGRGRRVRPRRGFVNFVDAKRVHVVQHAASRAFEICNHARRVRRSQLDARGVELLRRRFPRAVSQVPFRQRRELWNPSSDALAFGVVRSRGSIWGQRTREDVPLIESALSRVLPHHGIDRQVRVHESVEEPICAVRPMNAAVIDEKRGRNHAFTLMHPSGGPKPAHARVHGGEARRSSLPSMKRNGGFVALQPSLAILVVPTHGLGR